MKELFKFIMDVFVNNNHFERHQLLGRKVYFELTLFNFLLFLSLFGTKCKVSTHFVVYINAKRFPYQVHIQINISPSN